MWGFHIVESHGSLADAQEQFKRALASGKERLYVRQLQIAALLYYPDERFEEEVMRVVNDMRLNREPPPPEERQYSGRWSQLWNIYYSRVLTGTSSNRSSLLCRRLTIWRHSSGYFLRILSPRVSATFTSSSWKLPRACW